MHGHQIFVDGAFNGDPHPGNILLTPDGKLGLIDYGQARARACLHESEVGQNDLRAVVRVHDMIW